MAHGIERFRLGIAQSQAHRHPFGILGDRDRERAKPAHRVRRKSQHTLR
ncbi:hypothetical protein GALL_542940 [mine drainage metagenome]|uniref:Uncharacterized protein n=1 Tax=mine drainage metagenome TaxID=410659 RepID=A0A1J5P9K3_9ZZZZ